MTTPPDMIWLDPTQHAQGYTADPAEAREGDTAFVPHQRAQAIVAVAYEAAAKLCHGFWVDIDDRTIELPDQIRALTPPAAQAALARMLADARRDGRKSGLRIAAALAEDAAAYAATSGDPLTQSRFGVLGRHILAAAEKEADHE
jgi:hypothetical protein